MAVGGGGLNKKTTVWFWSLRGRDRHETSSNRYGPDRVYLNNLGYWATGQPGPPGFIQDGRGGERDRERATFQGNLARLQEPPATRLDSRTHCKRPDRSFHSHGRRCCRPRPNISSALVLPSASGLSRLHLSELFGVLLFGILPDRDHRRLLCLIAAPPRTDAFANSRCACAPATMFGKGSCTLLECAPSAAPFPGFPVL